MTLHEQRCCRDAERASQSSADRQPHKQNVPREVELVKRRSAARVHGARVQRDTEVGRQVHAATAISRVVSQGGCVQRKSRRVEGHCTAASSGGVAGDQPARNRQAGAAVVREDDSTSKLSSLIPEENH
jgi:hypothetical protein